MVEEEGGRRGERWWEEVGRRGGRCGRREGKVGGGGGSMEGDGEGGGDSGGLEGEGGGRSKCGGWYEYCTYVPATILGALAQAGWREMMAWRSRTECTDAVEANVVMKSKERTVGSRKRMLSCDGWTGGMGNGEQKGSRPFRNQIQRTEQRNQFVRHLKEMLNPVFPQKPGARMFYP